MPHNSKARLSARKVDWPLVSDASQPTHVKSFVLSVVNLMPPGHGRSCAKQLTAELSSLQSPSYCRRQEEDCAGRLGADADHRSRYWLLSHASVHAAMALTAT